MKQENQQGGPQARFSLRSRLKSRGRRGEIIFITLAALAALALIGLVLLMVFELVTRSLPALQRFGAGFLTGTEWNPVTEKFGALSAIYGTLVTSLLALLIAVPVSIGAAVFLAELAPGSIRGTASFLMELLAAVPSVVYGLWAIFVLVPVVIGPAQQFLGDHLGFLPFFKGPNLGGFGILSGSVILAIMVLPLVTATARDIIRMVPDAQKEAMLALGATRWETLWKVVLPYGRSGIVGSVILGLGRALGETMAVTMVIGNSPRISVSLFSPAHTMASQIASEFSEATGGLYISALIELALVLFAITLVVNVIARLLVWKATGKFKTGGRS